MALMSEVMLHKLIQVVEIFFDLAVFFILQSLLQALPHQLSLLLLLNELLDLIGFEVRIAFVPIFGFAPLLFESVRLVLSHLDLLFLLAFLDHPT
mmetsp:Transcript_44057/g.42668  ORF Transcript_44057/g.42668 Transcript_44057/m.42668 type:complete len:95 (-) Transcript_44057:1138-1422(-)